MEKSNHRLCVFSCTSSSYAAFGILLIIDPFGCSWTDQQRAQAAKEGWGYRLVFTARLVSFFASKISLVSFLSISIPLLSGGLMSCFVVWSYFGCGCLVPWCSATWSLYSGVERSLGLSL